MNCRSTQSSNSDVSNDESDERLVFKNLIFYQLIAEKAHICSFLLVNTIIQTSNIKYTLKNNLKRALGLPFK